MPAPVRAGGTRLHCGSRSLAFLLACRLCRFRVFVLFRVCRLACREGLGLWSAFRFGLARRQRIMNAEMLAELLCDFAEGCLLAARQRAGTRRAALVEIDDFIGGRPVGRVDGSQCRLFAAEGVFR